MILRRPSLAVLAVLAAALPALAGAQQQRPSIVVGSPDFRPMPIAVAAFQGEGDAKLAADATEVVRGDLVLSGLFDVLDPRGFLADPTEGLAAPSIRFARWADVGAEGLVKARVRRAGQELEGELHLYEVRAGREVLLKTLRVGGADARGLAHRIADEVVRYYTREPGIFSTQLAAVRKGKGTWDLVAVDVDGGNARVLLSERTILLAPAWRPDGREILVTSYRTGRPQLWAFRLADRSFRPLGGRANAMGGVYSPDGSRVAFTVTQGANTDIWVMGADGTGARQLTHSGSIDVSPTWSPDGRRIAFTSDRAGTPQLYVMNADGSGARRITFQGNYNQTPVWSPRGDLIAFTARDERRGEHRPHVELPNRRENRRFAPFGKDPVHKRPKVLGQRVPWMDEIGRPQRAPDFAIDVEGEGVERLGPGTVARDRFDYSTSVSESWKRQTLLNIVKLRYLDPPIFVDVGQIVSGYSLETGVTVSGQVAKSGAGDQFAAAGYLRALHVECASTGHLLRADEQRRRVHQPDVRQPAAGGGRRVPSHRGQAVAATARGIRPLAGQARP